MSADESRRVALEYLAAAGRGDLERVRELLSPAARCWLPGPPHWGRVLTRDEYLSSFGGFTDLLAGEFVTTFGPVIAEGNRVAVQMESSVPLRDGRIYNNQYHIYFEVEDGRIVVLKGYMDTLHFAAALGELADLPAGPPRFTNLFERG